MKRGQVLDPAARCTCAKTPGRLCASCVRLGNLGWPIGGADAAPAAPRDRAEGEGADYARALLDRIGAGTSNPDDLAALMQFLHSGALLHGFAAVIFDALRRAARSRRLSP